MRAVHLLLTLVVLAFAVVPALAAADSPAPTVAITSPAPGLTIAADSVSIAATYSAPGKSQIVQLELLVDGTVVELRDLDPPQASGSASFDWAASRYADGHHRIGLRVTDSEGRGASAAIRVLLSRSQPRLDSPVRVTSPKTGDTVSGTTSIEVEAGPRSLVKYVIFLVDDVFKAMSNVPPFTYLWDTTRYLNGLHRLQAKVYLTTGAEPLSPSVEVRVDNPAGATTLQAPKALPTPPAAPEPAKPPVRAAEPVLPPPMHTESASTPARTIEVAKAEVATPGTAPFVSPTGDLIMPPAPVPTPVGPAAAPTPPEVPVSPAAAPTAAASPPVPPTQSPVAAAPLPAAPVAPAEPVLSEARQAEPAPTAFALLPAPTSEPAVAAAQAPAAPVPAAGPAEAAPARPREPEASPTVVALLPTPAPEIPATPARTIPAAAASPSPLIAAAAAVPSPSPAPGLELAMLPPRPAEKAPTPAVAPAPAVEEPTYIVQAGDCLWAIAADHKVSPVLLAQVNDLADPSLIHPGQRLRIPSTRVYCDGKPLTTDVTPAITQGRAIVPLRAVVEGAGGTVNWQPTERRAQASLGPHQLAVTIGSAAAKVNGETVMMGKPATLSANRTLVPLRFLGDALDLALHYQSGIIRIATKP